MDGRTFRLLKALLMTLLHVCSICWYLFPSSGSCSLISSELKMGSKYIQEHWHISHSSSTSCKHWTKAQLRWDTAYWILFNAANEILYVCECMYLSHSELALPGVDAALEGFLEGWEGHALCHDNVVIQQLGGFIWALQDESACLLVRQHLKLYCGPLLLHLI